MAKSKNISTSQLALMIAAAVISLRGLPMMAQEELTMFFHIFFATFVFLIPAALVGAELGSAFAAKGGGVYTWVKEAFNPHLGFTAIFLQWIQNVVWYPTVLGFAAASIAYTIGLPALAQNGPFVGLFSIAMYWFATWVTLRGTSAISGITSRGFLIGTVLPGIVIVLAAAAWLAGGNGVEFEHIPASVSQVVDLDAAHHAHPRLFPHITGMSDIAFLAGILLLFAGVEVHAVHAPELKNPQKQFPRAMFLAALISFGLFTLGALAVAVITPYDRINLQSGLFTTFQIVFEHYRVGWLTNVMSLLVAFGALAGVLSWISGPSRGLLWTANEGRLPRLLQKTNRNGVQINILIIQGCIVTALSSLYIFMKDVSVAFFLLSALTIGLYLIMYMMMYAAARLPRSGRQCRHVGRRRHRLPRRALLVRRHLLPAVAVARRQPRHIYDARRLRHGAVPRRPHRHQHRDGPPARQRPPYLKSEMRAGPFGLARIAFRPLPQRFRIAPSAVTRSVTSRSRSSSSSTSYQSPSGVSTKSAPSIPNAA